MMSDNDISRLTNIHRLHNYVNITDNGISSLTNMNNLEIYDRSSITYKSLSQLTNISTLTINNNKDIRRYHDDSLFSSDNMAIVWIF